MNKKFKLISALTLTLIAGLTLSGCSSDIKETEKKLSNAIANSYNLSAVAKQKGTIENFSFLGADFEKADENKYIVDISGVALNNSHKGYTTITYEVPSEHLDGVKHKDKTIEVMNALNKSLENSEIKDFQFINLEDYQKFNKAIFKAVECPIKEFDHDYALVYSLTNLNFNEEEGYVSFQTKTNTTYSKTTTELVYAVVSVDDKGNPIMGFIPTTNTDYEHFIQTNNFYLKATPDEIEEMKQDSTLVFKKIVEKIEAGEKSAYTVQSVEVLDSTYFNTNISDVTDLKEIENCQ